MSWVAAAARAPTTCVTFLLMSARGGGMCLHPYPLGVTWFQDVGVWVHTVSLIRGCLADAGVCGDGVAAGNRRLCPADDIAITRGHGDGLMQGPGPRAGCYWVPGGHGEERLGLWLSSRACPACKLLRAATLGRGGHLQAIGVQGHWSAGTAVHAAACWDQATLLMLLWQVVVGVAIGVIVLRVTGSHFCRRVVGTGVFMSLVLGGGAHLGWGCGGVTRAPCILVALPLPRRCLYMMGGRLPALSV